MQGAELMIATAGSVAVVAAKLKQADMFADIGVIYVIDTVLILK